MSQPLGVALASASVAMFSAYVTFHSSEVIEVMWRTRFGAAIDPRSLRVLRYFAVARIVALLGMTWASPDAKYGLIAAALMTAHAVLGDLGWKHNWSGMTFTRIVGCAFLVEAIIYPFDAEVSGRIVRVIIGLLLMFAPQTSTSEPVPVPSNSQLFATRLLGTIGTVLFGIVTARVALEASGDRLAR